MKKFITTALKVLGIALLLLCLWVAESIFGNPIAKHRAIETAKAHLAETYPEHSFEITDITHSNSNSYHLDVAAENSMDTHFEVAVDDDGTLLYDTYTEDVTGGQNVYYRHERDYRELATVALSAADLGCPKDPSPRFVLYGDRPMIKMEPDHDYDVRELAALYGELYYHDQTLYLNSYEDAAEFLLKLKSVMDKADLPFVCVTISQPRNSDLKDREYLSIFDFPYEEIYEENLAERLREWSEHYFD